MHPGRPLLILVAVAAAGCPTKDQFLGGDAGGDGQHDLGGDGGGADHADAGAEMPAPPNVVTITSPTATTTYTNGTVSIAVATQRPTTDSISIVATNTTTTATLAVGSVVPPATAVSWDTSTVAEGTYSVAAQLATGGAATKSNTVTIIVDRTPPTVVTSGLVPQPNAADVVLVAPIVATFSEPILASTINAAAIPIEAGFTTAPTTVSLSADGKIATLLITNDTNITLPATFTATFAATITDLAGNPLLQPVLPWTWNVPTWIRLAQVGSNSPPLLAVGADFHPVIGYSMCTSGGQGCNPALHIAKHDGQSWNELALPGTGTSPTGASLLIDANGRPVVAYTSSNGATANVAFATWTGASWDATTPATLTVPTAAGYYVDLTALALDGSGNIFCAYRANTGSAGDIYVARYTGSTWDGSYGALGAPGSKSFNLVVDDKGSPIVSVINSTSSIDGAFTWAGTSWMLNNSAGATGTALTLDANGAPVMVNSLWQTVHLSNGNWLPALTPVPVSSSSRDPSLTTTSDRRPVAAWLDATISPAKLGVARWSGSAWDNRLGMVGNGSGVGDVPPGLVVDGRGSIWLSWVENLQANVWMGNY
jgi:hypothetical protein